jgi:hypothetical protein
MIWSNRIPNVLWQTHFTWYYSLNKQIIVRWKEQLWSYSMQWILSIQAMIIHQWDVLIKRDRKYHTYFWLVVEFFFWNERVRLFPTVEEFMLSDILSKSICVYILKENWIILEILFSTSSRRNILDTWWKQNLMIYINQFLFLILIPTNTRSHLFWSELSLYCFIYSVNSKTDYWH